MDNCQKKTVKKHLPSSHVRFTEAELARIQRMQQATGRSIPDLLKGALLKRFDLERPLFSREDADRLLAELRRQGNNLNQIAKQINSGLMTGWSQSFNALVRGYVDLRHMISVNHANR